MRWQPSGNVGGDAAAEPPHRMSGSMDAWRRPAVLRSPLVVQCQPSISKCPGQGWAPRVRTRSHAIRITRPEWKRGSARQPSGCDTIRLSISNPGLFLFLTYARSALTLQWVVKSRMRVTGKNPPSFPTAAPRSGISRGGPFCRLRRRPRPRPRPQNRSPHPWARSSRSRPPPARRVSPATSDCPRLPPPAAPWP